MLWLTWRRHRWLFLIGALLLLAFSAFFLNNGLAIYHVYNTCHTNVALCVNKLYSSQIDLNYPPQIVQSLIVLPLLIGVFVGAPLIPGEQRTASFIRTQGVALRRWLTIKLGLIILATLFSTVILALVLTWWTPPIFALNVESRWSYYESTGYVLIGKALFALLLSITIGALIRRTLPAMVVTFFLMIVLMIGLNAVYPHILPPTRHLYPVSVAFSRGMPADSLSITSGPVDQNGQSLSWNNIYTYCSLPSSDGVSNASLVQCGKDKHLQWEVIYQPIEHYWPMQIIESSVLLVLSLLLLPVIYWLSRRYLQ
jgi:hypothetical protein